MLSLPESVRIFLCTQPVDMRKGFDSLAAIVQTELGEDLFSGHLFVFKSRRGNRIKLLYWDRDGLVLFYKRLEKNIFRFPAVAAEARSLRVSASGGETKGRSAAAPGINRTNAGVGPASLSRSRSRSHSSRRQA